MLTFQRVNINNKNASYKNSVLLFKRKYTFRRHSPKTHFEQKLGIGKIITGREWVKFIKILLSHFWTLVCLPFYRQM